MTRKSFFFLFSFFLILSCSLPEPEDYVPPVTLVIFPYDGAVVSDDIMQVRVEATDDETVSRVRVYLDGAIVGTATSEPYLVEVNVADKKDNQEHVIQASATDDSDNTGFSELVRFTISGSQDVTDPVVAIVNPGDGQQVEGTVRIVATADDNRGVSSVSFFVDGDSVGESARYPYTYDWNTTGYADSTNHTIFARAFDEDGNWAVSDVVTVTVFPVTDQTPPTAILTYPTAGQVVFDTVQVTVEASDNKGVEMVEYFVDGQSRFIDMETPFIFAWDSRPFADDGSHSIYAKAYDAAGNTGTTGIIQVTVPSGISDDVIPPEARVTYPVDGSTVAGTVTVTVDVDDNIGVTQVQYFVDGMMAHVATEAPWNFSWNTSPIADGSSHTLFVKAFDAAGNTTSSDLLTLTIVGGQTVDTTPPTATITYPVAASVLSGEVSVVVDVTDNVGVEEVEFYVDGELDDTDTSAPWGFTWDTTPLADNRTHTIFIKSYDAAGNSTTSATVSVTLARESDNTPPSASITFPVAGSTVSGNVNIAVDADDENGIAHIDYYIDGDSVASVDTWPYIYTWNTNSVDDGTHTIYVKAFDLSGNRTNSDLISVTVENDPEPDVISPTVVLLYPVEGSTVDGTVAVAADAEDNVGVTRVEFYVDGVLANTDNSAPWGFSWNTGSLVSGTEHTIYVKAFDAAGNVGTSGILTVTKQ